jgi:FkbM family methyltransferase
MKYPVFLAKVLRRLGVSQFLDLSLRVHSISGPLFVPISRGLAEYLLGSPGNGFKSDLCKYLASHRLFPGVVCDVGLNTGQTLLEFYGQGLPISQYYGFEPNVTAMAIVERLVRLNPQLSSVQLMPWACSSEDAPLRLFAISEIDSGATHKPSIRPDLYQEMAGTLAASYRLDTTSSLMRLCRHFFLKIDVEGGELDVLRGAANCLTQWRPIIQCEVLHAHRPSELAANDKQKAELLAILRQHNYLLMLCRLSVDGTRLEGLEPLAAFPSAVYADTPHTCDYLFLPQELSDQLAT